MLRYPTIGHGLKTPRNCGARDRDCLQEGGKKVKLNLMYPADSPAKPSACLASRGRHVNDRVKRILGGEHWRLIGDRLPGRDHHLGCCSNREQGDPTSPEMGGGYGEKDKDSVVKYVYLSAVKKIVQLRLKVHPFMITNVREVGNWGPTQEQDLTKEILMIAN